jgi:hypothetical protein
VAMLDDPNTILVDCWFLSLLVKARVSGCPMLVTVFTIRDHEKGFQNFLRLTRPFILATVKTKVRLDTLWA